MNHNFCFGIFFLLLIFNLTDWKGYGNDKWVWIICLWLFCLKVKGVLNGYYWHHYPCWSLNNIMCQTQMSCYCYIYILRHQTSVWGFVSDDVVLTECMGLEDSLCLCTPFVVSVFIVVVVIVVVDLLPYSDYLVNCFTWC